MSLRNSVVFASVMLGAWLAFGAWLARPVAAAGSITWSEERVKVGTAPTKGQILIDENAPAARAPSVPQMEPLPDIGTFSATLPAFPGGAQGGAAFSAASSVTLPGGTHDFTTFDVAAGAVVTLEGTATIRTTGAVTILGDVVMNKCTAGSMSFECGGDFTLGPGARVQNDGGRVTLEVGEDFTAESQSRVEAQQGVTVRAHGLAGAAGDMTCTGATVSGGVGGFVLQAAGGVSAKAQSKLTATATAEDVLLQAFGGDIVFESSEIEVASAPAIRVESANAISLTGLGTNANAGASAVTSNLHFRAFGGEMRGEYPVRLGVTAGTVDVRALGELNLRGWAPRQGISGSAIRMISHSDVVVTGHGNGPEEFSAGEGTIEFLAARDVRAHGPFTAGRLRMEAHAGDVALTGLTNFFRVGDIEALAANRVELPPMGELGLVDGWSLDDKSLRGIVAVAGAGGIRIGGAIVRDGGIRAVAAGEVRVLSRLISVGEIALASYDAGVYVGGDLLTVPSMENAMHVMNGNYPPGADDVNETSARIALESFADDNGSITVAGSDLRTGDATVASGDIVLAVHSGRIADATKNSEVVNAAVDAVQAGEGFIAPTTVKVQLNALDAFRSVVAAKGFLDAGPGNRLEGTTTLTVGDEDFDVNLVGEGGGRVAARGQSHVLTVVPSRNGSSRAKFTLRRLGLVDSFLSSCGNGSCTLGFRNESSGGFGTVLLDAGRYQQGRIGRSLPAWGIQPLKCKARLADGSADSLSLEVGIATTGEAPAAAPDVQIRFGDQYLASIPASAFARGNGDVFTANSPAPGVRRAVLDYSRGTLSLVASGVELGTPGDRDGLTTVIGVTLGTKQHAVRVRLGRSGSRFVY